jgi:hypothetical protein
MRPCTTLNALVFLVDVIAVHPALPKMPKVHPCLSNMYRNLDIQLNKIFGIFISR